jgi:hypothetical protein
MMDKYEFDAFMQDIFNECKTIEHTCGLYVYSKNKLDDAFKEKISSLVNTGKGGASDA